MATSPPKAKAAPKTIIRRVTLPRFEVIYGTVAEARAVANIIKEKKFLALAEELDVAVGNQVVLDLAASGCAAAVTLLFRVIGKRDGSLLEFWARRETDTAALDLWIEGLSQEGPAATDAGPDVVELCQRALKRNPFDMLGVHWSADADALADAGRELMRHLTEAAKRPQTPRVAALIRQAGQTARASIERLATPEARAQARQTYVPGHQLRHARELLATQLEMARVRQDRREMAKLQKQRRELGC